MRFQPLGNLARLSRCTVLCVALLTMFGRTGLVSAQPSSEERARQEASQRERDVAIEQSKQQAAQVEELSRQLQSLQDQLQAQRVDMVRRSAATSAALQQSAGSDPSTVLQDTQQQLAKYRAALEALQQRGRKPPLPENAQTRVFTLRYSGLPAVGNVLADIAGERGMRMGMDQRTNSLIISADPETLELVEALLQQLDRPPAATSSDGPLETLQLRVLWLLDGVEGKDPAVGIDTGDHQSEGLVSPQVVEALHLLGFDDPKVVCQQVTTLTVEARDRRDQGQFQFSVPVLVGSQAWQLTGNGRVTPASDDRFSLQFELEVEQPNNPRTNNPRKGRLGGSIFSPLGHYTVMGTTTFVDSKLVPPAGGGDGPWQPQQEQHLSAFVVYLDRAPEFPAKDSPPNSSRN